MNPVNAATSSASTPTYFLNSLTDSLRSNGYTISESIDPLGEIVGTASKNGQLALSFSLADQVVTGAVNTGGECTALAPGATTPTPVLVAPDGSIPHITQDFNWVIDPSVFSNIDFGSMDQAAAQNEVISSLNDGYFPYSSLPVPQPTQDPNAGGVAFVDAADLPTAEYSDFQNGQMITQNFAPGMQTMTLIPGPALPPGDVEWVPGGSAQAFVDALNAGKEVTSMTINTEYFGTSADVQDSAFEGDVEHEYGHPNGLGDDYANANSPMRGGDLVASGPIPISNTIAAVLTAIQQKSTFSMVKCTPGVANTNVSSTPPTSTINNAPWLGPLAGYVPIYFAPAASGTSATWIVSGSCTNSQLSAGYINDPTVPGGCRLLTPSSTVSIIDNDTPTSTLDPTTCHDNYGNLYLCTAVSCGNTGEYACPINVPQGSCLDANGNIYSCCGGIDQPLCYLNANNLFPTPAVPTTDSSSSAPAESSSTDPNATCTPNSDGLQSCTCNPGYSYPTNGSVDMCQPDDTANMDSYCANNPTDPNCVSYCAADSGDPACTGDNSTNDPSYCTVGNPDDPSCGGTQAGEGGGGKDGDQICNLSYAPNDDGEMPIGVELSCQD